MGEFSPATWGSNYNACHIPGWAPDAADSALGQLQAHMGSNSKWNTIREAFMRADTDGNGVIMRDELQVMCREMHLSSDTAAALLNQFDLDENGEWNYAEFCEVLKKQDYVTYADCVPRDQFRRTDPKRMPSPVPAIKPTARQYDMLNGAALSYVEADAAMQLSAPKQAAQYSPKSWRGEGASSYQADWIQGGGSMEGSMIGSLVAGQSVRARAARCARTLALRAFARWAPSLGHHWAAANSAHAQRWHAAPALTARPPALDGSSASPLPFCLFSRCPLTQRSCPLSNTSGEKAVRQHRSRWLRHHRCAQRALPLSQPFLLLEPSSLTDLTCRTDDAADREEVAKLMMALGMRCDLPSFPPHFP